MILLLLLPYIKEYKENAFNDMAEKYKGMIPYKVYHAMMEWKIKIDD